MSGSKSFDDEHDFPEMSPPSGKPVLTFNKDVPVKFTDLIDTFNSYTGLGGRFLMVSISEEGVTVSSEIIESDKNYVHSQSVAALEWIVDHSLDKYPSVSVVNDSGNEIIGEISHVSENQIAVRFDIAVTGKVYCN
jgi:hypothetical protein